MGAMANTVCTAVGISWFVIVIEIASYQDYHSHMLRCRVYIRVMIEEVLVTNYSTHGASRIIGISMYTVYPYIRVWVVDISMPESVAATIVTPAECQDRGWAAEGLYQLHLCFSAGGGWTSSYSVSFTMKTIGYRWLQYSLVLIHVYLYRMQHIK